MFLVWRLHFNFYSLGIKMSKIYFMESNPCHLRSHQVCTSVGFVGIEKLSPEVPEKNIGFLGDGGSPDSLLSSVMLLKTPYSSLVYFSVI